MVQQVLHGGGRELREEDGRAVQHEVGDRFKQSGQERALRHNHAQVGWERRVRGHYSHVCVEVGGVLLGIVHEGGQVNGGRPAKIDIPLCVDSHCQISGTAN